VLNVIFRPCFLKIKKQILAGTKIIHLKLKFNPSTKALDLKQLFLDSSLSRSLVLVEKNSGDGAVLKFFQLQHPGNKTVAMHS